MTIGSCPNCGGAQRRLIAPGYFECETVRALPDPASGYPPRMMSVGCGFRYQEGSPVTTGPACYCGTMSIGTCSDCGRAVCGDHSRAGASRRCVECIQAETDKVEQTHLAHVAQYYEPFAAAMASVADPTERLLRMASSFVHPDSNGFDAKIDVRILDLCELVTSKSKSLFKDRGNWAFDHSIETVRESDLDWDSAALARWYVQAARARGVAPEDEMRVYGNTKKLFGGNKVKVVQRVGRWMFATPSSGNLSGPPPVIVLEDGRLFTSSDFSIPGHGGPFGYERENPRRVLRGPAWQQMARNLGMADKPYWAPLKDEWLATRNR